MISGHLPANQINDLFVLKISIKKMLMDTFMGSIYGPFVCPCVGACFLYISVALVVNFLFTC